MRRVSVGTPEGKTRSRRVDDTEKDVREIREGGVYWIHLAQDRDQWRALVTVVMNFRVPSNVRKFLSS
jgi:hypothetical protein